MVSGQAFIIGSREFTLLWSVSCLPFVIVPKLPCLVWCLQPTLLAFPYTRCENVSAGCHQSAASGRELFCCLSQFFVHWGRFLRVFIIRACINKPWGFWYFLGLFYCRFLFILGIWVCINKLWGFWYFLGLFYCRFLFILSISVCINELSGFWCFLRLFYCRPLCQRFFMYRRIITRILCFILHLPSLIIACR